MSRHRQRMRVADRPRTNVMVAFLNMLMSTITDGAAIFPCVCFSGYTLFVCEADVSSAVFTALGSVGTMNSCLI